MSTSTIHERELGGALQASIPARFARVVARHAARVAISTPEAEWSYAELDQRSDSVADLVLERSREPSEVVALLCAHGPALIAAILGVLKAGRIYLALDPADAPERWRAVLADAGARLVLADREHAPRIATAVAEQRELVLLEDLVPRPGGSHLRAVLSGALPAWLMYTSGSTGAPRGVWQSHESVVHHSEVYAELVRIAPDDRLSLLTSCSLSASATQIFAALLNGAALCPFHVRSQGLERLVESLHAQRVTVYHSVPTVFRRALRARAPRADLESLRLVRLGGESALQSDVELVRRHCPSTCVLMHSYSSTETCMISALMLDPRVDPGPGALSVGQPVRGADVRLLDAELRPVERGAEGRIAVRGAHLARGYWRAPEATAAAFRPDPDDPRLCTFLSGDLGRWRVDGTLEHLGRADNLVKIRGQRVSLAQVEAALSSLDEVEEAVATAAQDAQGAQRLVAYVVPRAGHAVTAQTCRRRLQPALPQHMIPDRFLLLPHLPVNDAGKVDRRRLPTPGEPAKSSAAARLRPRDSIEQELAQMWESLLDVASIGRTDDFFELGGTSLVSLELLARIESTFGLALPPATLIEHSTIEALAMAVAERAIRRVPGSLVQLRAGTAERPLFFVHEGKGNVAVYGQLSRLLRDRPSYALQAAGLNGESWPGLSLPAMARRYVREITAVDPTGPYLLAGSCMGGMIAFEMAQQLVRAGRPVALLALMDTECPVPGSTRARWKECTVDHVRDALRMLRWAAVRAVGLGRSARWLPAYRRFVNKMIGRARRLYRPTVYPGALTLCLSAQAEYPHEDPRVRMQRHARETRLVWIPSRPAELFQRPHVEALAQRLEACIDDALADQPAP